MHPDVLRDLLPQALAGTVDPVAAWRRYRDAVGRDDIDGFLIWLADEYPGQVDLPGEGEQQVEVSEIVPARFAAERAAATTWVASARPGGAGGEVAKPAHAHFPYVLLGRAGRGGMGTVHVARDTELARRVALKELNADAGAIDGVRARFVREAQITAQLDHPNVVPVYALEMTPDGLPAYTMKFVQGKTFQALIEETRDAYEFGHRPDDAHSQATVLEHFLKVADAIAYAHDKGVIHRDLKPANLMLGRHHEVYVMDWGLCRLLNQPEDDPAPDAAWVLTTAEPSGSDSQTRAGDLLGTPRYMSPEQADARHDEIDARSDQYALGLILHEMVTLQVPYEGRNAREVLANARAGRRSPVKGAYRGLHVARELRAIIERATALLPAQRYADVGEFAADLRRFLRDEAVLAAPDTLWQRLQRALVRHRQQALVGMLSLVALSAVAIGGLLWHNQRVMEQRYQYEQRVLLLRNAVADVGDRIQTRLLQLEGTLGDLASSTQQALQYAQPSEEPVYLLRDFTDPAQAPPDLRAAPASGGHISLRWPVWTLAPGVDEGAAMPRIRRLANLQGFYGELYQRIQGVLRGGRGSVARTQPATTADAAGNGILAGILLGLEDGIASTYPGWDGVDAEFDPRSEDWYRIARHQHGPRWGEPVESTLGGPATFPLSIPLHDRAQQFLGVLSLRLVPQRFLHDVLDLGDAHGVESVLLTNAQGRILASAHRDAHAPTAAQDLATAAAVLARLHASNDSILAMEVSGVRRLVIADNIDPLDWTLIAIAADDGT